MEVYLDEATSGSITRVDGKVVTFLLPIYIVEATGISTPTIIIGRMIATEHVTVTQQGQDAPMLTPPQKPMAGTVTRENVDQEQRAEEERGRAIMNTEDQGDSHEDNEDGGIQHTIPKGACHVLTITPKG